MNEIIDEEINSAAYEICQVCDVTTDMYIEEIAEILQDLIKSVKDLEEK